MEEDISQSDLEEQIKYVQDNIVIKKQLEKDTSFEEGLIEEWKRYLPDGDKHHLWIKHLLKQEKEE